MKRRLGGLGVRSEENNKGGCVTRVDCVLFWSFACCVGQRRSHQVRAEFLVSNTDGFPQNV